MDLKKDLVLETKDGEITVYPYGSEEQQRYEKFLEILTEAIKKQIQERIKDKHEEEQRIDRQIEEKHKKRFRRKQELTNEKYNLTQTAQILKVHRQTIYYWIKKKWVTPKRDFKGYPIFTVLDIERLIEWKNTIKIHDFKKR